MDLRYAFLFVIAVLGWLAGEYISSIVGIILAVSATFALSNILISNKYNQKEEENPSFQLVSSDLLSALSQTNSYIDQDISHILNNMKMARSIQSDAIKTLGEAFTEFKEMLDRQEDGIRQLLFDDIGSQDGRMQMSVFAENTQKSLSQFTDTTAQMSTASLGLLARVNKVSAEISEVIKTLRGIDQIAVQTGLLVLNAVDEVTREGERGWDFAVVANEISALSNQSSDFSRDIQRQLQNIDEAITDIAEGVGVMTSKNIPNVLSVKKAVEATIDVLLRKANADLHVAGDLKIVSSRLTVALNNAIRGLQFEDISSQNIDYTKNIVMQLLPLLNALANIRGDRPESTIEFLSSFQRYCNETSNRKNNPVSSFSMEAGDIEIF